MANQWSEQLESLLRTSDRMIDPCEHRYIRLLADADTIDVWEVKDILDRCVCYALCAEIVILFFDNMMTEECQKQGLPVPKVTRLNLLDDAPGKRAPYDDEDARLARLREPEDDEQDVPLSERGFS